MLSTVQMIILVIAIMIAGAIAGIAIHLIRKDRYSYFNLCSFSNNYVEPKMQNSNISIDDVVKNFKLFD